MKIHQIILALLLLSNPVQTYNQTKTKPNLKKLNWLIGSWTRTNAKPGETASETWKKVSPEKFIGLGITMKGADTVFSEKLQLLVKGNALYYAADVAENKEPTLFKLTDMTANGFVCENTAHDFPKKIVYKRSGNTLKAIISGDGKSIDFNFIKNTK
ncbi:DUF6265 family protein [Mucilaginibacter paludis]|uniref:Lipoprotein n=1 Tax=Mucilaginibacter paludis DSM 18603 TaxID=714943 RepID=H1YC82_9SPHI|nr:DUF6265 family protein [Mucilaginibacter paludis]EHQ29645.1 lipoprotein [Mucilaginibacter paludis DSM 18603]